MCGWEEGACVGSARSRMNAPLGTDMTFQFIIREKMGSKK